MKYSKLRNKEKFQGFCHIIRENKFGKTNEHWTCCHLERISNFGRRERMANNFGDSEWILAY